MKRKVFIFLIGLLFTYGGFTQSLSPSVLATDGAVSQGKTISLEWTLGEAAVQTIRSPNGLLTEGFHQPTLMVEDLEINTPQLDTKVHSSELQVTVAPNPVKPILHLTIESDLDETGIVQIVDLWGKTLQEIETNLSFETSDIDLTNFPAGMYMLYLRKKDGAFLKTFKITKVN